MLIYQKPSAVANSTINELFVFSNGQIKRLLIPRKTNTGPDFCCIFVFCARHTIGTNGALTFARGGSQLSCGV